MTQCTAAVGCQEPQCHYRLHQLLIVCMACPRQPQQQGAVHDDPLRLSRASALRFEHLYLFCFSSLHVHGLPQLVTAAHPSCFNDASGIFWGLHLSRPLKSPRSEAHLSWSCPLVGAAMCPSSPDRCCRCWAAQAPVAAPHPPLHRHHLGCRAHFIPSFWQCPFPGSGA